MVPGGQTREVKIAEMTASGFAVSSAKALMGRTLNTGDERAGAPPVAVIGYEVWKDRFGSDPAILGKSVKIGDSFATVVGVMDEGYAFPIAHEVWMPLRVDELDRTPRGGVSITVFGRLADGASYEKAQAELDVIGRRMATQFAQTHEHLRPRVISYVADDDPSPDTLAMTVAMNGMVMALLVLVCGNVALLLFARAATRETELTVRSALGASRGRLVMQLFAEALVLGGVAAAIGLGAADITLRVYARHYLEINYDTLPFWFDPQLSPTTVLYALGLTVFGAVIAGVLPALKVTRSISSKLRQGTTGGGLRFSGVWTFVIVAQVAATVLLPAIVALEQNELSRIESYDFGFRPTEYLTVNVETDAPLDTTSAAREAWRVREGAMLETLRQRIASEPGVRGVAFVTEPPGTSHDGARIQLADSAQLPKGLRVVGIARAEPNYFSVLGAPILSGRGFHSGDLVPGARNVIVDLGFVKHVLGGMNPLGRQIQIGRADSSWWEIVGVVKDLGMVSPIERSPPAGIYKPATPEMMGSPFMMIHASGDPLTLTARLRAIAESVDPTIRLNEITRMDRMADPMVWFISPLAKDHDGPDGHRGAAVARGDLCGAVVHRLEAYAGDRRARGGGRDAAANRHDDLQASADAGQHRHPGRVVPGGPREHRREEPSARYRHGHAYARRWFVHLAARHADQLCGADARRVPACVRCADQKGARHSADGGTAGGIEGATHELRGGEESRRHAARQP